MPAGERRRAILDAITRSWWSQTESNRRHPACKAGALPTELWPHSIRNSAKPRRAVGDAVLRLRTPSEPEVLVGPGRLELPTLRLSGVRSNHLSYGPMAATARSRDPGSRSRHQLNDPYGRGVDDESGKRNGDGGVPPFVPSAIALLLERISYWSLNRQPRERRPGEASLERR